MFRQAREVLLLEILQFLDVFYLFGQQQDCQADEFFVDGFFQGYSAVFFESNCRDVLEGFDAGGVDVVEKSCEIHFFFVSIESEEYLDFLVGVDEAIFL